MRIITANVNGIRSAHDKGFCDWLVNESHADIICLQEIKANISDLNESILSPSGYQSAFFSAQKKGYSGVGFYFKDTLNPKIITGLNHTEFDNEGRCIRADFNELTILSIYFPSGSSGEDRQQVKFAFLDFMSQYLNECYQEFKSTGRNFILCGDWNIAHTEKDLKNWKGNLKNSGFLPEERDWMTKILASGWIDVYRSLHPDETENAYTWWSNRGQARQNNVGWRIDYQICTPGIAALATHAKVFREHKFSDHAPLIIDYTYGTL